LTSKLPEEDDGVWTVETDCKPVVDGLGVLTVEVALQDEGGDPCTGEDGDDDELFGQRGL
jgi:hypothetical protein